MLCSTALVASALSVLCIAELGAEHSMLIKVQKIKLYNFASIEKRSLWNSYLGHILMTCWLIESSSFFMKSSDINYLWWNLNHTWYYKALSEMWKQLMKSKVSSQFKTILNFTNIYKNSNNNVFSSTLTNDIGNVIIDFFWKEDLMFYPGRIYFRHPLTWEAEGLIFRSFNVRDGVHIVYGQGHICCL